MTIHFMCSCGGKNYYLPDDFAGEKVRCPTCRIIMIVPQPNERGGQVVMALPAEDEQGGIPGGMPGEEGEMGGEWE